MTADASRIRRVFGPLAVATALTLHPVARAGTSSAPDTGGMTLDSVLESFDHAASLAPVERSLNERAAAQAEVGNRRLPGPFGIGLRAEVGRSDPKTTSRPATAEAVIKRRIALGVDDDAISGRYNAEAQADLFAARRERREQELEVARLYTQLLQRQNAAKATKRAIDDLTKIIDSAAKAARAGTLGAFLATRWQLMFEGMKTDLVAARSAFALSADALGKITGRPVGADPLTSTVAPIPAKFQSLALDEASNLAVLESLARQRALASEATAASSLGEMEAGVGISRDFEGKTTSVIIEVDMPLGVASASASGVRALERQQAALKATSDYQFARARDRFALLSANSKRLNEASRIASARVSDLEGLYGKATKAFARGQGDASEVIETARELYESRLKVVDIAQERDEAILTLYFFAKGDIR